MLVAAVPDLQGGNAMLAHDLVVRPTQGLDLFTSVAADETLALSGRAAARDLVDVAALSVAAGHPNDAFAELGLSDEARRWLRGNAQQRRAALLAVDAENPT